MSRQEDKKHQADNRVGKSAPSMLLDFQKSLAPIAAQRSCPLLVWFPQEQVLPCLTRLPLFRLRKPCMRRSQHLIQRAHLHLFFIGDEWACEMQHVMWHEREEQRQKRETTRSGMAELNFPSCDGQPFCRHL